MRSSNSRTHLLQWHRHSCLCSAQRQRSRSHRVTARAFSLVEIMIVVVIIGLMAGLVTYAATGYLNRAKTQRTRSDLATYAGAVDSYYLVKGAYPSTRDGLAVLVPEFIKTLRNDPWGNAYQYLQPGRDGPYDIISYGADGREGGSGADADLSSADAEVTELKHK